MRMTCEKWAAAPTKKKRKKKNELENVHAIIRRDARNVDRRKGMALPLSYDYVLEVRSFAPIFVLIDLPSPQHYTFFRHYSCSVEVFLATQTFYTTFGATSLGKTYIWVQWVDGHILLPISCRISV